MFDVLEFAVKTDRYILADIGQGFSLSKARVRGVTDDSIFFDVVEQDIEKSESTATESQTSQPTSGLPVELTVYYDDNAQDMKVDDEATGSYNYVLPEPQEGQSLTFGLKNTTGKPLGVVLLVNGTSTLYEQQGEAADLNKWVLEPGKEYRVKGYHREGNETYARITTLSEEESKSKYADLGGEQFAGLIHMYVFQTIDQASSQTLAFTRSIGRLPRRSERTVRFSTLSELQQAIARKSDLYPKGVRPLAGWGKEENETIEETKLGDVALTDTLIVRYSKSRPD
jgi:hypothetical protein